MSSGGTACASPGTIDLLKTTTQEADMTDTALSLPAATQAALDKVSTAKAAWLEASRLQAAAAENAETIRQRRAETEATANAQNDEWRALFRDSSGAMTPEMRALRTEIALNRETLEEFDALLASHAEETARLPFETADRAQEYISAHNSLVELRAMQLWQDFMRDHGQPLIQTLSLLHITLGRQAALVTGVVDSVNDPESVLKGFIKRNITEPAVSGEAMPDSDPVFRLCGVTPDATARADAGRTLSPAARHKARIRLELKQKESR